jgi:hypothetical protein
MTFTIKTRNKSVDFIIDDEDFELVSTYKWATHTNGRDRIYARGYLKSVGWESESIRLHRLIVGLKNDDTRMCDHKNQNTLDCRKDNLRICDRSQNGWNRRKATGESTSKYLGVSTRQEYGKTRIVAHIQSKGKRKQLGSFETHEDAARAYDRAAYAIAGEFANLNFKDSINS